MLLKQFNTSKIMLENILDLILWALLRNGSYSNGDHRTTFAWLTYLAKHSYCLTRTSMFFFFFCEIIWEVSRERDGLGSNERRVTWSAHVVTENHSILEDVRSESITEKMNLSYFKFVQSAHFCFVSAYTIYYTNGITLNELLQHVSEHVYRLQWEHNAHSYEPSATA